MPEDVRDQVVLTWTLRGGEIGQFTFDVDAASHPDCPFVITAPGDGRIVQSSGLLIFRRPGRHSIEMTAAGVTSFAGTREHGFKIVGRTFGEIPLWPDPVRPAPYQTASYGE